MGLVKKERLKIEKLLNMYNSIESKFKEGDYMRITYFVDDYELEFLYPKERYEPKEKMIFKGVKIGSRYREDKKYPVVQLLSFFQNNCESFDEYYRIDTLSESIEKSIKLIDFLKKNENNHWQTKIEQLIEKKYPW